MKCEVEEESMKYKTVIRKSKHAVVSRSTKEYIVFFITRENSINPTRIKLSFLFDWEYDKEDGFSYKKCYEFSGHKRCNKEEKEWLENYCKQNYPDMHHMSY